MKFIFDVLNKHNERILTTTNINELPDISFETGESVSVLVDGVEALVFRDEAAWEEWQEARARAFTWRGPKKKWDLFDGCDGPLLQEPKGAATPINNGDDPVKVAVDPSHYKGYIMDLQWMEAMQYLPRYRRDPGSFVAAVELQIRKYMDRCGGKDVEVQELSKALWYMKFLVAFVKNDYKPIRVSDIEVILKR